MNDDIGAIEEDLSYLKNYSHKEHYRQRAEGIFGKYIRNGRNATSQVADKLYEGVKEGVLSENDVDQVLAADLLWSGETREERIRLFFSNFDSLLADTNTRFEYHLPGRGTSNTEVLSTPLPGRHPPAAYRLTTGR